MGVLDRMLGMLQARGHRVVLFSQFNTMLDLLEDYLLMRGHRCARLPCCAGPRARHLLRACCKCPRQALTCCNNPCLFVGSERLSWRACSLR